MQVVGDCLVTNTTRLQVLVAFVKLRRPQTLGFVSVRAADSDLHGQYPIAPGATTEARFVVFIDPPVRERGDSFRADVALVDQFGNEHWLRNVDFRYT
jgi:hypothetical protein